MPAVSSASISVRCLGIQVRPQLSEKRRERECEDVPGSAPSRADCNYLEAGRWGRGTRQKADSSVDDTLLGFRVGGSTQRLDFCSFHVLLSVAVAGKIKFNDVVSKVKSVVIIVVAVARKTEFN